MSTTKPSVPANTNLGNPRHPDGDWFNRLDDRQQERVAYVLEETLRVLQSNLFQYGAMCIAAAGLTRRIHNDPQRWTRNAKRGKFALVSLTASVVALDVVSQKHPTTSDPFASGPTTNNVDLDGVVEKLANMAVRVVALDMARRIIGKRDSVTITRAATAAAVKVAGSVAVPQLKKAIRTAPV